MEGADQSECQAGCFASEQPNASHNEAVAWDCRNDLTMQRDAAVLLRHGYEDPRVSQRIDRLAHYLSGKVPVHSVQGEGDTPFAALMDLVMIGDYHLAPPCRSERRRS